MVELILWSCQSWVDARHPFGEEPWIERSLASGCLSVWATYLYSAEVGIARVFFLFVIYVLRNDLNRSNLGFVCECWNIKWQVFWKYTNLGKSAPNDCSSGSSYCYHVPVLGGNEFPLCHASRPAVRRRTLLSIGHKVLHEGKATGIDSWPLTFL